MLFDGAIKRIATLSCLGSLVMVSALIRIYLLG
jgi:hypothetical protein